MKKYFKEEKTEKISLLEFYEEKEKEYQKIVDELEESIVTKKQYSYIFELENKKRHLTLPTKRIRHIYRSLGDVKIREDMIDILYETFDSSKCRYGSICVQPDTIRTMYEISELFPELTKEAIVTISRVYIKDLFDKYSLIDALAIAIRKEGLEDLTFEKYMAKVLELAEIEDRKYSEVAWQIRIHCGEYSYDFVTRFEKFVKEHHISWETFYKALPPAELILKDQVQLKELSRKAKDCWGTCDPVSFQMFEDYLDGDKELSCFDEQPEYYISTTLGKVQAPFTKTQFLESISEQQKVLKLK